MWPNWKDVNKYSEIWKLMNILEDENVSNVYDMESWHPIISQSMDFVFVVWTHSKQLSVSKFRVSKWLQVTHLVPLQPTIHVGFVLRLCFVIPSISPSYPHYGWLYTPRPIKPGYTSHWPMVCPKFFVGVVAIQHRNHQKDRTMETLKVWCKPSI